MFLWGFLFPWKESRHVFHSFPWCCVRECAEGLTVTRHCWVVCSEGIVVSGKPSFCSLSNEPGTEEGLLLRAGGGPAAGAAALRARWPGAGARLGPARAGFARRYGLPHCRDLDHGDLLQHRGASL